MKKEVVDANMPGEKIVKITNGKIVVESWKGGDYIEIADSNFIQVIQLRRKDFEDLYQAMTILKGDID